MKNRYFFSFAALVAILLLPIASNAQSSGVSITPDPTCMKATCASMPGVAGGSPSVPAHAASFRVTCSGVGTSITNITVTRPTGVTPAAPGCFSACVDGNSSRNDCDVTDVSVNLSPSDPQGSHGLVLSGSGPGTLQIKVTTSSMGANHVATQNVTTQNVLIP